MADKIISAQKHDLTFSEKGVGAGEFKTQESGGGDVNLQGVNQSLPPSPGFSDTGDVPIPMATIFEINEGTANVRGVGTEDS